MKRDFISILMPVFNASEFIVDSINSILNQTYPHFEFIIIDDASTDNTVDIVKSINDSRIILHQKKQNTGYTNSLNWALNIAKGEYIARMDADDISLPNRLEEQVKFLNENRDVILCGTWFQIFGTNSIIKYPSDSDDIKIGLLTENVIGHPTVMFRKKVIEDHKLSYDPSMEPSEDYHFWIDMIPFGKLVNIPKPLLIYRKHNNQVSINREHIQSVNAYKARLKLFRCLLPDFGMNGVDFENDFMGQGRDGKYETFIYYEDQVEHLYRLNSEKAFFPKKEFVEFIEKKRNVVIHNFFKYPEKFTSKKLYLFFLKKQKYYKRFKLIDVLKISIKCLIHYRQPGINSKKKIILSKGKINAEI